MDFTSEELEYYREAQEAMAKVARSGIAHFFGDPEALDDTQVGGKNAKLAQLYQSQIPVPPGFAVPSSVFTSKANKSLIIRLAQAGKYDEAQHAARETPVPCSEIMNMYEKHIRPLTEEFVQDKSGNPLVSVRSSAIAEDAGQASFAGQLSSYLYVEPKDICDRIQDVWASFFQERTMAYKRNLVANGQAPAEILADIRVAVVVQAMLDPDASGVLFTAHVAKDDRNTHVIHAVPGVGENYVAGHYTPDEFLTDKTGQVQSLTGEHMLLNPSHIHQLTNYGNRSEQIFGSPQDMEWASKGDKVYVLQSRPITTLTPTTFEERP